MYNKTEEFHLLLDQYEADVICVSESWERDNYSLKDLLQLSTYEVITNVVQRDFSGGKPAIIINLEKFHVKPLCPDPITVPIGVECVWALITPKKRSPKSKIQHIAVASIYYRGPKSTKKDELFDHIAETYHFLVSKYGSTLHFILMGDTNRLNLSPITNLSPNMKQAVKVPTRLNPPAILDPILTTMEKWYQPPVTKPPINANPGDGVPSDHLIVLMCPLFSALDILPRVYRTVVTRPLTLTGFQRFSNWIENYDFKEIYECQDGDMMADKFQNTLFEKYIDCFPEKILKVCDEDKPWISAEIKQLDRQMKREFCKHKKSQKWHQLKSSFETKCEKQKEKYYDNMVHDLKTSNPGKWYSKVKRMAGIQSDVGKQIILEDLDGYSNEEQADVIAKHYSDISNQYEPIQEQEFSEYFNQLSIENSPPEIQLHKVNKIIGKLNISSRSYN